MSTPTDADRRRWELHKARAEVAACEFAKPPGHPWTNICGPVRGDHSWCSDRLERARKLVALLEGPQ